MVLAWHWFFQCCASDGFSSDIENPSRSSPNGGKEQTNWHEAGSAHHRDFINFEGDSGLGTWPPGGMHRRCSDGWHLISRGSGRGSRGRACLVSGLAAASGDCFGGRGFERSGLLAPIAAPQRRRCYSVVSLDIHRAVQHSICNDYFARRRRGRVALRGERETVIACRRRRWTAQRVHPPVEAARAGQHAWKRP